MADYLSREEILRVFDNLTVKNPDDKYQHGMQDAIDCLIPEVINGMEVADTVKHGRWSECYTDTHHYSGICSVCGKASIKSLTESLYAFCPKCGAKMDAEPNEPWQSE